MVIGACTGRRLWRQAGSIARVVAALAVALGSGALSAATAVSPAQHPAVAAFKHGDCNSAVDLVNHGLDANDQAALFLAGRMLDEGACVQKDPAKAAGYFERASALGEREASLEYAAKIGLGEGAEQSYERAGEICRNAGVDGQRLLSSYALGYACTLRAVAGRILRDTLPRGAFIANSGTTRVEFTPQRGVVRVLATPSVARDSDASLGTHISRPVVDARHVVEVAWNRARDQVPAPDAARLDDHPIELSLDVELTVEAGGGPLSMGNDSVRGLSSTELRSSLPPIDRSMRP